MSTTPNPPGNFGARQFQKTQFAHDPNAVAKGDAAEQVIRAKVARPALGLKIVSIISLVVILVGSIVEVGILMVNRDSIIARMNDDYRAQLQARTTGRKRKLSKDQQEEMKVRAKWHENLFTIRMGSAIVGAFFGACIASFFVIAAYRMANLMGYRHAYAASILAMIPICSPLVVVGIPFGIWSFMVLNDKDVKRAFKT